MKYLTSTCVAVLLSLSSSSVLAEEWVWKEGEYKGIVKSFYPEYGYGLIEVYQRKVNDEWTDVKGNHHDVLLTSTSANVSGGVDSLSCIMAGAVVNFDIGTIRAPGTDADMKGGLCASYNHNFDKLQQGVAGRYGDLGILSNAYSEAVNINTLKSTCLDDDDDW